MEYSNPELPEGINVTQTNHLKEFVVLTAGVIGVIVVIISILIFLIDNYADKIPFEAETSLPIEFVLNSQKTEKLPQYLANVSESVIDSMSLSDGMTVTLHYINDDTVNAFATLGGHVFLHRGLLEKLRYEDELAMLIAHEVAHVKNRHPILSVSHGIAVGVVLALVNSSAGTSVIGDLLGQTSKLTLMQYSREFESKSDEDASESLIQIYGHAKGAIGLFEVFSAEQANNESIEFFSTHPLNEKRMTQAMHLLEKTRQSDSKQEYTLLSGEFIKWLASEKEKAKLKKKSSKIQ